MMIPITVTSNSYDHYNRPEIKEIITGLSKDENNSRCGNGDFIRWYKTKRAEPKTHYNLSNIDDYNTLILKHKTLYWSLNYFEPYFYSLNFDQYLPDHEKIPRANSSRISKMNTNGYMLSVDIDGIGDIHEPHIKHSVETVAQYYADELMKYAPDSVYVLFSGGGIYVHLHHKVLDAYFKNPQFPYDEYVTLLLNGFGEWLNDIWERFKIDHPGHDTNAKADSLNGAKRLFKTIFSIHKSKPYCVIPLNPKNIKIDFEKAKLPLKQDVIDDGKRWYKDYDTDGLFLNELMKYIEISKVKKPIKEYDNESEYERSETPINIDQWAPCMKNLLSLEHGTTRARAVISVFMGQVGIPEQQAYQIFLDLSTRWNQPNTNVFESNYRVLRTPTCQTLTGSNNQGYPTGRSLKLLNVCKPDIRCINIISPRYYADNKANAERLKRKLIGDISTKRRVMHYNRDFKI